MSYAGRLHAMSRAAVPAQPRAFAATADLPREEHVEHVEAEAVARPAIPDAGSTAATLPRSEARPRGSDAGLVVPSREARVTPNEPNFGVRPAAATVSREIVERREVHEIDHERVVLPARPMPAPIAAPERMLERVVLPSQAQWLAEDPTAEDPLVASADTEELRELMRTVRRWTAGPPMPIAHDDVPPAQAAPPAPATPAVNESTQVSIGNVTITVEDAEPAPSRRATAAAAPRVASDRMARNHIRGG